MHDTSKDKQHRSSVKHCASNDSRSGAHPAEILSPDIDMTGWLHRRFCHFRLRDHVIKNSNKRRGSARLCRWNEKGTKMAAARV